MIISLRRRKVIYEFVIGGLKMGWMLLIYIYIAHAISITSKSKYMSPSNTKVIQIPKAAAVKLSSKSAGAKTQKKSTEEERVKSMVKSLIKEIDNHGEQIKANVATKKTFAAESRAAKLNQRAKAVSSRVIKKALSGNVDKKQVELKSAVHAEILKRGVGKSILKLVLCLIMSGRQTN